MIFMIIEYGISYCLSMKIYKEVKSIRRYDIIEDDMGLLLLSKNRSRVMRDRFMELLIKESLIK